MTLTAKPGADTRLNCLRWLIACACLLGWVTTSAAIPEPEEADLALQKGDYRAAIDLARKIIPERPRNEEIRLTLLRALTITGQYPEARNALTNALTEVTGSIRLLWEGRNVFQAVGETNRAAELTEQVRQMMSDRPWGFREPVNIVVFGEALLSFGVDPKDVLEKVFGAAQKLTTKIPEPWIARGRLALDKHDYPLAAKIFREAAEKFHKNPDILFGLAQAVGGGDQREASAALEAVLAINPHHLPSLLLLADQRIDSEDEEEAQKHLSEVLAVNPWHPDAWAYRAVLAHLHGDAAAETAARDKALHFWNSNPRVDYLIGEKLSQKYRFSEGAAHQRQALQFDPEYAPAQLQLARDELRLGNEEAGWKLATSSYQHDAYDIEAFNLVQLKDTIDRFVTLTNADLLVRMEPKEAAIYGDRALQLLERARRQLTAKYQVELVRPTTVEIFNDQKDFGVRTFGMPENPGFLGVCFGRVVTANSPAANTAQPVNWEAVLWHEFCHSVTLTLTHNRMPRWLSEGISVYEEIQANPSWGQHLNPRYREMILKGELTPVSKLSGAFLAPPSPLHLQFAYFEAEWVVEFIVEHYGQDHLLGLLQDLRDATDLPVALARRTAPAKALDAEFDQFARQRAEAFGKGLDWTRPPSEASADGKDRLLTWAKDHPTNYWAMQIRGQTFSENGQWTEARDAWRQLLERQPGQTGPESAYWSLAAACRELGDTAGELDALNRGAELDHEAPDAYQRLIELAAQRGDWSEMQRNCQRWLAVNPLVAPPYRYLAQAAEAVGNSAHAVEAYLALLQLDPPNPAQLEFQLARALHRIGDATAKGHLLRALEETPRHREALHLLWQMTQPPTSQPVTKPTS